MSAVIWDSTAQAFKDADTPNIHNGSSFGDAEGRIWNETAQAWEDAWSKKNILYDNGIYKQSMSSILSNSQNLSTTFAFKVTDNPILLKPDNEIVVTYSVGSLADNRLSIRLCTNNSNPTLDKVLAKDFDGVGGGTVRLKLSDNGITSPISAYLFVGIQGFILKFYAGLTDYSTYYNAWINNTSSAPNSEGYNITNISYIAIE